jgi:hypothetical protein
VPRIREVEQKSENRMGPETLNDSEKRFDTAAAML